MNTSNIRLPVRPRPNPQEESLSNYCLRVAEANGYRSPTTMLATAGIYDKEWVGINSIEKLSQLVDVDTKVLEQMAYLRPPFGVSGVWTRAGQFYDLHHASRINTRICPDCIKELGHTRAIWDIRMVVSCPRHNTQLLYSCPACSKPLTWKRKGLLTCSCGCQLGESARFLATESSIRIASLIEHAMNDDPHSNGDLSWCPREIADMPIDELLRFMTYLETHFFDLSMLGFLDRHAFATGFDVVKLAPMVDTVERVIAEWPLSHARMIAREFECKSHFENHVREIDFLDVFGENWDWAQSRYAPTVLSNEIKTYLSDRTTYQNEDTALYLNPRYIIPFIPTSPRMRGVRLDQGAELLGISTQLFLQFAERGVFKYLEYSPSDTEALIFDIESILSIKPQFQATFDYQDAAKKLVVSEAQLSSLVTYGVLEGAIGKKKSAEEARFRIVDLAALNSRFADLSRTIEDHSGGHGIQVKSFWPKRPYVAKTRAFGLLVQAILNGEIKITSPQSETRGIGDHLIDVSELELAGFSICNEWFPPTTRLEQLQHDKLIPAEKTLSRPPDWRGGCSGTTSGMP